MGLPMKRVLVGSVKRSIFASAAVEPSGEPIAVWGITAPSMLADCGEPWLLTGRAVERHKRAFVVESREWVEHMLTIFPRLENYVDSRYDKCLRWLDWLGFSFHETRLVGEVPFYRFERTR